MIVLKGTGNSKSADIPLDTFPYLLGRKERDLVQLGEKNESFAAGLSFLSRKHATVYEEEGTVKIRDEESLNGTEINGRQIGQQGTELHHGDNLVLAGKLRFIYENSGERAAGKTVRLEVVGDSAVSTEIECDTFPLIIGPGDTEASLTQWLPGNETGNILRISCEGDSCWVEELGSRTEVLLNGEALKKKRAKLEEGGELQIGPRLKLKLPASAAEEKTEMVERTKHGERAADDAAEDPLDRTVYMESPTRFIKVVTEGDGRADSEGKSDTTNAPPPKRFPVKPVLYTLLFIAFGLSLWGGVHYYTHSGIPQAEKLVSEGKYQQALVLVEEKLRKKPGHKAASGLLFQIVSKEYMTKCAAYILQGDLRAAGAELERGRQFDQYNPKIKRYHALLQLFVELSAVIADPEAYEVSIERADSYTSIQRRWSDDIMENRSIVEELVAIDPVFTQLRKKIYGKLSALKLIVNRKVPEIDAFLKKLKAHLEANSPEKIEPLLQDTALFEGISGVEVYREDLQRYLVFDGAVKNHDAAALLEYMKNPQLKSDIFHGYYTTRIGAEVPSPEVLTAISRAEGAWYEGQSRKAVSILRGIQSNRWQQYIASRLRHMEEVSAGYDALVQDRGRPGYPRALMEFRGELTTGKDVFYEIYAEREAARVQRQLQSEYENLFSQFRKKWELYQKGGRISTIQRMENRVSDTFKKQADELMAAFNAYEEAKKLVNSFKLTPAEDMGELGQKLTEEVVFQRQMVVDLQMVLSGDVYEGKMKLLPRIEM